MPNDNEVKRWKVKTYKNVDVLFEDTFYARTPAMNRTFPPTEKATYTIISENEVRSTIEQIPLEPLPEPKEKLMKKLLKKVLQWIATSPPKYKFVFVLWEDANSDSSWNELSTIEAMLPTICMSTGFIIKQSEDAMILASDFTTDYKNGDYVISEAGNTMVIPSKNVLKVVQIP